MVVFAVIAAVLIAVSLIPIRICADFRGSLQLWVKVLFLRFDIIPSKKKKSAGTPGAPPKDRPEKPREAPAGLKEENNKSETEKAPEEKTDKPEKDKLKKKREEKPKKDSSAPAEEKETESFVDKFLRYYSMVRELFEPFRRAMRRLVHVDSLSVTVRAGTQDAAMTAIYTGMLWGIAANIIGLTARFVTLNSPSVNIVPAYNETVLSVEGGCIIRLSLANIIGAALIAGIAYLKYVIKSRRNKK